ncbi:hypothetical protein [Rhizobium leguminosarum]|uniref:hypothetical protein n=1 Tax=Rhizobium leguminosarum TaxID=384 RepID=UPI002E134E47|nr:hypothetical protein U8Q02_38675 [Rhizobium leguminosarum]
MTTRNLPSIEQTRALALSLHGPEYFGHLERVECYLLEFVALLPEGLVSDEDVLVARHVAYLHDSIEDGYTTRAELEAQGYDDRILVRVEGLTRDPAKEVYQEKIEKIAASGDVVLVLDKLADNKDNSTKDRIVSMPPERWSLVKRYRRARATLHEGYRAILLDQGMTAEDIGPILAEMGAFDTGDY